MSDHMPDTDEVRFNYTAYEDKHTIRGLGGTDEGEFAEEFDRWLEEERRKAILDYEMNRKVSVTVENIDGKAAREWHAGEIRKAKAEAWDQGVLDGAAYAVIGASAPPNPYREESAGD